MLFMCRISNETPNNISAQPEDWSNEGLKSRAYANFRKIKFEGKIREHDMEVYGMEIDPLLDYYRREFLDQGSAGLDKSSHDVRSVRLVRKYKENQSNIGRTLVLRRSWKGDESLATGGLCSIKLDVKVLQNALWVLPVHLKSGTSMKFPVARRKLTRSSVAWKTPWAGGQRTDRGGTEDALKMIDCEI